MTPEAAVRSQHVDSGNCRLRIASYPESNLGNPYRDLFYRAPARHGIEHAGRLVIDPACEHRRGIAARVETLSPARVVAPLVDLLLARTRNQAGAAPERT